MYGAHPCVEHDDGNVRCLGAPIGRLCDAQDLIDACPAAPSSRCVPWTTMHDGAVAAPRWR
jgi:hypothetical protein